MICCLSTLILYSPCTVNSAPRELSIELNRGRDEASPLTGDYTQTQYQVLPVYSVQCTVYSEQSPLKSLNCRLYSYQGIFYTIHRSSQAAHQIA